MSRAHREPRIGGDPRAGFTLVEILVVMGMLGVFLLFLTQMLGDSLRLWQRGEERASLEDRAAAALDALKQDFLRVQALTDRQFVPGRRARFAQLAGRGSTPPLTGRLYAHWLPFLPDSRPAPPEAGLEKPLALDWFPEVRVVTTLSEAETQLLSRRRLAAQITAAEGELDVEELEQRVQALAATLPVRAPGEVVLRVLPTGEEDGCYLALFRDRQLLDEDVRTRWVDGAKLGVPGEPVLSNLLYVEFLFRKQFTEDWSAPPASKAGPEACWDSARAGTFVADHAVLDFFLDLDADSLMDPLDDVMPSAVQIRVVVDEGPGLAYTARLLDGIDPQANDVRIDYPDRVPPFTSFVKVGGEWIRYTGLQGNRLVGVKRGQRNTAPRTHRAGARVHVGREAMIRIPIAVAREYWNG